jgi:methylthioribose-1-phosphate isomerase
MRGTHEEFQTDKLLGDFGLILKDIGGPSVIGSMALSEIFAGFEEAAMIGAGFSGGPVNPPLGHLEGDCVPAMRLLLVNNGDIFAVADAIREYKENSFIDPEMALCGLNTIARKAEQVTRGSITRACILASEGVRDRAIYRRAAHTYDLMKGGKSVGEACRILDEERKAYVEQRGSQILSGFTGKKIQLAFTSIKPHGRRTDKFTARYWGFDANASYDISIDGKKYHVENLSGKEVPAFALEGKNRDNPDWGTALFAGAVLIQELQYIGHTIINVTVPAAVATLLGADPKKAAADAEEGAYLTRAIPGAGETAGRVATLAHQVYEKVNQPFP